MAILYTESVKLLLLRNKTDVELSVSYAGQPYSIPPGLSLPKALFPENPEDVARIATQHKDTRDLVTLEEHSVDVWYGLPDDKPPVVVPTVTISSASSFFDFFSRDKESPS